MHTPGPWVSRPNKRGEKRWISGRNWSRFASVYVAVEGRPNAQGEANACLIAAAPELLEALRRLADDVEKVARDSFSTVDGNFYDDYLTEDPDGYAVWSAAKTAIAKAEGRQ